MWTRPIRRIAWTTTPVDTRSIYSTNRATYYRNTSESRKGYVVQRLGIEKRSCRDETSRKVAVWRRCVEDATIASRQDDGARRDGAVGLTIATRTARR